MDKKELIEKEQEILKKLKFFSSGFERFEHGERIKPENIFLESIFLIESLQAELDERTAERDAAIEDLKLAGCIYCADFIIDKKCKGCKPPFDYSNFRWRGIMKK